MCPLRGEHERRLEKRVELGSSSSLSTLSGNSFKERKDRHEGEAAGGGIFSPLDFGQNPGKLPEMTSEGFFL